MKKNFRLQILILLCFGILGCEDQAENLVSFPEVDCNWEGGRCHEDGMLEICTHGKLTRIACKDGCTEGACVVQVPPAVVCTPDHCQDVHTLITCDQTTGLEVRVPCAFGCDVHLNKCQQGCAVEGTKCSDDGLSVLSCVAGIESSQACLYGCLDGACLPASDGNCTYTGTKCSDDGFNVLYCEDGRENKTYCRQGCVDGACDLTCDFSGTQCAGDDKGSLWKCEDGVLLSVACANGCVQGACIDSPEIPVSCDPDMAPTCLDHVTALSCETYDDGYSYAPLVQHCGPWRMCIDGQCIFDNHGECNMSECFPTGSVTACKNLTTLQIFEDGVSLYDNKMPCRTGELCIHDACVPAGDIKVCASDADCASHEVCHQSVCYTQSNMEIPVGSPCDAGTFEEYCIGDLEYWCDYDGVVAVNDCADYNGCSLYIKPRYPSKIPIRNAICRGNSDDLAECGDVPGPINYHCLNVEDEYMSFYYSLADACVFGTDGRMIYLSDRDEYQCNSPCHESTGLCHD